MIPYTYITNFLFFFVGSEEFSIGELVMWEMERNIWYPMKIIGLGPQIFMEYIDSSIYV